MIVMDNENSDADNRVEMIKDKPKKQYWNYHD